MQLFNKKKQFYEKVAYISSNVTNKFKKRKYDNYRKQCTINIVYIKKYEFAELIVQNNWQKIYNKSI